MYSHKPAADEQLIERIVAATEQPYALDAFASIALSPKSKLNFDQLLQLVRCPICLLYGECGRAAACCTVHVTEHLHAVQFV